MSVKVTGTGLAKDGRGREIHVVATGLPGKYPVLGVQLLNSGAGVSKDGVRTYTADGKFYANSGRTADELDLVSFEPGESELAGEEAPEMVTMVYMLRGSEIARREVERDSEDHDELSDSGWEEAS